MLDTVDLLSFPNRLESQICLVWYLRNICVLDMYLNWINNLAYSNLNPDFSTQMNNLINVYPKKQIAVLKVFLINLDLTHIPSIHKLSSS